MTVSHKAGYYCHFSVLRSANNSDTGKKKKRKVFLCVCNHVRACMRACMVCVCTDSNFTQHTKKQQQIRFHFPLFFSLFFFLHFIFILYFLYSSNVMILTHPQAAKQKQNCSVIRIPSVSGFCLLISYISNETKQYLILKRFPSYLLEHFQLNSTKILFTYIVCSFPGFLH